MMQVTYTNRFLDFVRFNAYHLPRMTSMQIVVGVLVLMHAWSFGPSLAKMKESVPMKAAVYATTLLLFFAVLLVAQFLFILLSYRPSRNKAFLTEHILTASDDGVVEDTAYGSSSSTWAGITKVGQNRGYIFVYVQENMAHVIPKRAFASEADASRFYDFVQSRVASTKNVGL